MPGATVNGRVRPVRVCYDNDVTFRHLVLSGCAIAVLGLGVFLFLEVRADPATPETTARDVPRPSAPEPSHRDDEARKSDVAVRAPREPRAQPPGNAPSAPSLVRSDGGPPNAVDIKNLDATMAEANKAYDREEFEDARTIAAKVLAQQPDNVRMLRIVVSASCILGDAADAQKHYLRLPTFDREQMKTRCARYQITFTES